MLPFRSAMFARPFAPGLSGNDPHWGNVSLLVGGITAPGDEGPLGLTPTNTSVSTTGTNPISNLLSIIKTANTGRMRFADNAAFELGTGAFTVEGFFKWGNATAPGASTYHFLISKWDPTGNQRQWAVVWDGDGSPAGRLAFWYSTNGSNNGTVVRTTAAFAPVAGNTYHIAVDYDGTKVRIYVNGALVGSATVALNIFNGTSELTILGRANADADSFPVASTSMADEIRITKGIARYARDSGFSNLVLGNTFIGWPRR